MDKEEDYKEAEQVDVNKNEDRELKNRSEKTNLVTLSDEEKVVDDDKKDKEEKNERTIDQKVGVRFNQEEDRESLQDYGYFTEKSSRTDLFYIINHVEKVLFAYDREKIKLSSNVANGDTLSEVERKPTVTYNFAQEVAKISQVKYISLYSETAIKILFEETEVVLILSPSNPDSKKKEEEFFYALKDVCAQENVEIPAPPSNSCCTIA